MKCSILLNKKMGVQHSLSNDHEVLLEKGKQTESILKIERKQGEPTPAFKGASLAALLIGVIAYLIGLFNAAMQLNEKGYYFAVLVFGLYSAISLQKAVRDKAEGIPVTSIYYGISWFALIISISLMAIGLYNAGSIVLLKRVFMVCHLYLAYLQLLQFKRILEIQNRQEKEIK